MAWMGHEHADVELPPGVVMEGMASPTELQQLAEASGQEAEILFLQLMLTHHIAGVEMAQAALELSTDPDVLAAAGRMVVAQVGEIRLMDDMLRERGSAPREDVSAWTAEDAAATTPSPGGHGDHGDHG